MSDEDVRRQNVSGIIGKWGGLLNSRMGKMPSQNLKVKLQRLFWIYLSNNFIVRGLNEVKLVEPKIKCAFIPITHDNFNRVTDFREKARISQYKDKLARGEIGFFAEHNGQMVGSVWATINKTKTPRVAQMFKTVMHNEGVVHDNIVSERFRGMRIGPFMESNMFALLFQKYGLSRVIADVNVKNRASLRMLDKIGLGVSYRMLYVSAFGRPVLELVLRKYS
jgi:RimJ/RimL family protein N-acetyltransferase